MTDWVLRACAATVDHQHGDRAQLYVAERIGTLALAGDTCGVSASAHKPKRKVVVYI